MDYASFPLFRKLNATQVRNFVTACEPITFPPGTLFIEQSDPGDRMYLVFSGEVQIFVADSNGGEKELVVIHAPAVIGEMELLTGDVRSASVRARTEVEALMVEFGAVQSRLDDGDPATLKVFYQIARVLAYRLAAMDKKIAEIQVNGDARFDDLHAFQQKLVKEWTV